MATQSLKHIEDRIETLRSRLAKIGNMRPGTLSVQYRKPSDKKVPFYQISYTHKGKGRSDYVRADNLDTVRKELHAYKRFKTIVEELIALSIQASRIRNTRTTSQKASKKQSRRTKCT